MSNPTSTVTAFLPYGAHAVDEDDIAAVVDVLRSNFLTTGPAVERFETAFAEAVDAPHAISCNSGTAALHMACYALGLDENCVAIVPTITFLATANAARFTGAEVVFADVDPQTGLLTVDSFRDAIARSGRLFPQHRIAAVFPVHLNGQSADMIGISSLAQSRGIAVVEDACHAVGGQQATTTARMAHIGSCEYSDITCFSFHPVKTIAAGEGGCCTTRDPIFAERMRRFRNHGMVRDPAYFVTQGAFSPQGDANPWYYEMPAPGLNYRLSDIHCALVFSQLKKLRRFVEHRGNLVRQYHTRLAHYDNLARPVQDAGYGLPAWHLMAVHINLQSGGLSRAQLMTRLRERGIGTQVHYIPVHTQPYYRARFETPSLPGAEHYYETILSFPLSATMEMHDVDRVVDALLAVLGDQPQTTNPGK